MIGSGFLCLLMANFMSHTAAASLLIPIIAAVGTSLGSTLAPLGGPNSSYRFCCFCKFIGMSLPISTPPNALAHATGFVDTKGIAKVGIVLGIIGLALTYVMMYLLATFHVL